MVSGSSYIHIFTHQASLCLLIGTFNPFTFRMIIDMYDLIAILLIVWGLIFYMKVFFLLRVSLSSHCKAALVVLNSFNYCLSGKLLISLSNLNVSLAKQNIIGYRFFPTVQFSSVQSLSRVSLFATP